MKDIYMNVHLGDERKTRFKLLCDLKKIKPSRQIKDWIDEAWEKLMGEK